MKEKLLSIMLCGLLLIMPHLLRADNDVHVVQLIEIPTNDDGGTRDGDGQTGNTPTDPTLFSATINGHILSVGIPEPPAGIYARLRVNNSSGNNVVDRRFRRTIVVNIADTGYYTLILNVGSQTLQGEFEITD